MLFIFIAFSISAILGLLLTVIVLIIKLIGTQNKCTSLLELQRNIIEGTSNSVIQNLQSTMIAQRNILDNLYTQLIKILEFNEQKLEAMRKTIEEKLTQIQNDNNQKLEKMRATVDEKLHDTLEKRLGASFEIVSNRLELVQRGLGEMQALATGVGDLKKILHNVKTRGVLGEVQLGAILENLMHKTQYTENVVIKPNTNDRVEYAIKLPGRDTELPYIMLPIDAKFPLADYQRLVAAQETANLIEIENAGKALETNIKKSAKLIFDKYIHPPYSTDFAIMFLPIESLYAEVLRNPTLIDSIQQDYRVIITGPTTLGALLSALQMGFKTLTIEKQSNDTWKMLEIVRQEFGKFTEILGKTRTKLEQATQSISEVENKTRNMQNKLQINYVENNVAERVAEFST